MHPQPLPLLAIETTMGLSSAAVLTAGEPSRLALRSCEMGREQAESLLGMIVEAMAEAGITFGDLKLLAVTTGPGSFSGVRAGLSAARGFALALGIGIVGVSGFEVMAFDYLSRGEEVPDAFAIAAPAGRAGLYLQCFSGDGRALSDACVGQPHGLVSSLPGSVAIAAGAGAESLANAAAETGRHLTAVRSDLMPSAAPLAHLALVKTPDDHPPVPLYLRPPDAKPQQSKILSRAGSSGSGFIAS